jgi:hypothetical protein
MTAPEVNCPRGGCAGKVVFRSLFRFRRGTQTSDGQIPAPRAAAMITLFEAMRPD